MNLKEFERLKRKVEDLQSDKDRAEGALSQLMDRLKKEFKCETVKQGKRLLARLEEELKEGETAFQKELSAFEEEFGSLLKDEEEQ